MGLQDSLRRDRVQNLDIREAVSVPPEETIERTIARMREQRVGCVTVQEGGELLGVFTERDVLKRVLAAGTPLDRPVSSVMTAGPDTVRPTDTVCEVISRIHAGGYRRMPVVDEAGRVVGMVSVRQIIQYLVEHFPEAVYNLPPDPEETARSREGG